MPGIGNLGAKRMRPAAWFTESSTSRLMIIGRHGATSVDTTLRPAFSIVVPNGVKDAAAIDDGREDAGPSRSPERRVVVDVERRDDERRVAAPKERDLMIGDRLKAVGPHRRVGRPALHVPELPVRRASVDPATRTRARRGRS